MRLRVLINFVLIKKRVYNPHKHKVNFFGIHPNILSQIGIPAETNSNTTVGCLKPYFGGGLGGSTQKSTSLGWGKIDSGWIEVMLHFFL